MGSFDRTEPDLAAVPWSLPRNDLVELLSTLNPMFAFFTWFQRHLQKKP